VELEFMVDRMEEREEVIVSVFLAGSVDIFRILVKTSLLMQRHECRELISETRGKITVDQHSDAPHASHENMGTNMQVMRYQFN
jgi:hypothetical protein